MKAKELKHVDANQFLTVEEAAELLGVKPPSLRNYLSLGLLATYKLKTLTLLKLGDVKRWKDRQKKQ